MTNTIEFIRLPEVRQITGMGTTTIYKMVNEGAFPRQVALGGRSVAWVRSEVQEWALNRIQHSRLHASACTGSSVSM
ncbi:helix-turn-helix transcriptional regulator [Pseudomonas aegrilactucae]|uniref:helix-turn-helix transcriptional regulator n=1 Tax=Pseudomonas aegrilactucae TaxID=2854028 RepID=UPI0020D22805|nr:AlpA family transcriptional regulator [Pseudomonas aegrilactucae]